MTKKFTLIFCTKSLKSGVHFTFQSHRIWTSHKPRASSHTWLVATILDRADFRHGIWLHTWAEPISELFFGAQHHAW